MTFRAEPRSRRRTILGVEMRDPRPASRTRGCVHEAHGAGARSKNFGVCATKASTRALDKRLPLLEHPPDPPRGIEPSALYANRGAAAPAHPPKMQFTSLS